jgi:erythromycin esterase-like protein
MTKITRSLILLAFLACLSAAPLAATPASQLTDALRALGRPLQSAADLSPLLHAAADAQVALLGEASHGTREFYRWRAALSQRLIRELGFSFIAIEGDWASLLPLDRYVRHHPDAPASAREALLRIDRWPAWVWCNAELEALGEWLRGHNRGLPPERRVGIHGIDLYAIWTSLDAVQAFYRNRLPGAAAWVRQRYALLSRFRDDYPGYTAYRGRVRDPAGPAVGWVARDLARRYRHAGPADRAAFFEALQHARVVEAGEHYLAHRGAHAWNTRSEHFAQTLARLLEHYGPGSRAIVWAHNTHIGDARATDMVGTGEVNLGQLVRERLGRRAVFALGLGTGTGTVSAAAGWDGERQIFTLPSPRQDSLEAALLASDDGDRLLVFDPTSPAPVVLRRPLPHRAIGVVFDPRLEPRRNYVATLLPERYDAFIFLPETHALAPLRPRRSAVDTGGAARVRPDGPDAVGVQ